MVGFKKIRSRFEQRLLALLAFFFALLFVLFLRLIDLQWRQHEGLLLQAEKNRINVVPLLPIRGEIYDRNGNGLAINHISYNIQLIPERAQDIEKVLNELAVYLDWDNATRERILQRIQRSRPDRPVLLADKLPWSKAASIAARTHHLYGVDVQAGTHRFYPHASLFSHVVGYLSLATPKDVDKGILNHELVGRAGLEKAFQTRLRGRLGYQSEEVDALGRRVRIIGRELPEPGESIYTSLDLKLQLTAAEALGDRAGAVVVMDVHNGEILVLLSSPGYDTNQFITGLEPEQWRRLVKNERHPLINRAIQAAYPPGSTFKPIVALAGLAEHAPLAVGKAYCPGFLMLPDRKLRCWKSSGHGKVGLERAIIESCDVYFYLLGEQLGIQALRKAALIWGIGKPTGVILQPENPGHAPGAPERHWHRGETMIAAIGQGAITVTPLQMARIAAALANGGRMLQPILEKDGGPHIQSMIEIDQDFWKRVRHAMEQVVANPHGTAHAAFSGFPIPVAGKTGTAQVISQDPDSKLQKKHQDHAWFMGFAPSDDPEIAFAVLVEHGGHGGSAAAPVAASVLRAWMEEYGH